MKTYQHLITLLAANNKGVLNRITSVIRRRQFNIQSMTAGSTELKNISRVTVMVQGKSDADQLIKQLYKIIEVVKVVDLNGSGTVREMALVKISKNESNKDEIIRSIDVFRGKVLDAGSDFVIASITGKPEKIDAFRDMVSSFGIKEMSRTGVIALLKDK